MRASSTPTRTRTWLAALCCAALAASLARADEVILKNGGAIRGRIVSEDDAQVVIETDAGKVSIARARIREVMRSQPQPPPRDEPAPGDAPAAPSRTLLLFAFDGADARVVEAAAGRVRVALGIAVEVLPDRPAPDERDPIDRRELLLPRFAQELKVDPSGSLEQLEQRLRAALAKDPRPEGRRAEAVLDDACQVRLSVARLGGQAVAVAGDRLKAPGVIGVIGVTNRDMTTPELNFLFGHGDRRARAGVASYLRFSAEGLRRDVLAHRLAVQLLSTTGVLLGLGRCEEASCARAFPNNLEEHDRKREGFCGRCRPVVEAALGR